MMLLSLANRVAVPTIEFVLVALPTLWPRVAILLQLANRFDPIG
jgi:hypothetical protein